MADVWVAVPFDEASRALWPPRAAIKTLLPDLALQPPYRERFAREAALHVTLEHPNIVRALGAGEEDGTPYLALDYVDGVTVRELLDTMRPKRVPPGLALEIASSACAALACLHDHRGAGLVHCDVSAENLMIGVDGGVKLIDFGLATPTQGSPFGPPLALLTETSTIALRVLAPSDRLQCVAPERLDGSGLDRRSDVYSVGVMLFELIHGARPFDAREVDELIERIRSGRVSAGDASADPEVAALIAQAMAVEPSARPGTAADLKSAIDRIRVRLHGAMSMRELVDVLVRRTLEAGEHATSSAPPPRSSGIRLTRKPRETTTPCPEKGSEIYAELQRLLEATRERPPAPTPVSVLAQVIAESEAPPAPPSPPRDVFDRPHRAADAAHDVFRGYSRLPPPRRHDPARDDLPAVLAPPPAPPPLPAPRPAGPHGEAAACFERGWRALRAHDLTRALEALEAALALDPGNRTYAVDVRQLRRRLGK